VEDFRIMIIGLSGFARSGKDTVADYLVQNYGFTKLAFADPMREALYRLNPFIQVADMPRVPLASVVDGLGWETLKAESPDLRPLMQRLGTEVGRQMFGENFWVEQAIKRAADHERVVFSDVRFTNEADAVIESGGAVLRVDRPNVSATNDHVSESAMDGYEVTAILNNSRGVDQLFEQVDDLLTALGYVNE
jgi:hypothetical protein